MALRYLAAGESSRLSPSVTALEMGDSSGRAEGGFIIIAVLTCRICGHISMKISASSSRSRGV